MITAKIEAVGFMHLTFPLRIYLKWKVKTEVRRMGEFVARERGRPSGEGVGFRMSAAKITWVSK
jgi:hypothetical protein